MRASAFIAVALAICAMGRAAETIEDVEKAAREAWKKQTAITADIRMATQMPIGEESVALNGKGTSAYLRDGERDLYKQEITIQVPPPVTMEIKNQIVYDGNYLYITNDSMGRTQTVRDKPSIENGNIPPGGDLLFDVLHDFLELARKPDSTVAERATYVIEGTPKKEFKDKAGFTRTLLYIDRETGFLMKTELFDNGSSPVATVEASNVNASAQLTSDQFQAPVEFKESAE